MSDPKCDACRRCAVMVYHLSTVPAVLLFCKGHAVMVRHWAGQLEWLRA